MKNKQIKNKQKINKELFAIDAFQLMAGLIFVWIMRLNWNIMFFEQQDIPTDSSQMLFVTLYLIFGIVGMAILAFKKYMLVKSFNNKIDKKEAFHNIAASILRLAIIFLILYTFRRATVFLACIEEFDLFRRFVFLWLIYTAVKCVYYYFNSIYDNTEKKYHGPSCVISTCICLLLCICSAAVFQPSNTKYYSEQFQRIAVNLYIPMDFYVYSTELKTRNFAAQRNTKLTYHVLGTSNGTESYFGEPVNVIYYSGDYMTDDENNIYYNDYKYTFNKNDNQWMREYRGIDELFNKNKQTLPQYVRDKIEKSNPAIVTVEHAWRKW